MADRRRIMEGDAFTAVPADYDTYMLSRVIHDWDDERAITIFTRCHQAMRSQGKLLLVERVIPADRTAPLHVLESDVIMLVAPGGKERTNAEYRALLAEAGFELTQLIPVLAPYFILEATRA